MKNKKHPRKAEQKKAIKYKKRIYKLCSAIRQGNKSAESALEKELSNNDTAEWAAKHWIKMKSRKPKLSSSLLLSSSSKIRAKKKRHHYGNAFKPYQGGAFELGKK